MTELFLLAQATQPADGPPPMSGLELFARQFLPLILLIGVFFWIMSRGRAKEQQRYRQMLGNLKKSDRVQTIGGILGVVTDVREHEVVLKVDETNNVKIRFNKSAIKEVLQDAAPSDRKD
jgi:preprotein translocase subunit YajC